MIIGGLQKTTLIDYPGKLACTVFLAGCNFRCPWCYSKELVLPAEIVKQPRILEKQFFDFLKERKGLLEGVVVCGGEPTTNKDLPKFIEKIKKLGYFVKLDTNGSNPEMLNELINRNLVNYVAMDIKVSPKPQAINHKSQIIYENLFFDGTKIVDIEKSVEILKKVPALRSLDIAVDFEFRTTVVPDIHKKEDFLEIAKWIGGKNVKYYLQNFRPEKTIFADFKKIKAYPKDWLEDVAKEISPYFKICKVR